MPEYIERTKAIKELHDAYEYEYPTASGAFDEFATTIVPNVLKNIPAADVVEVVRCKDCRFWDNGRCEGIENGLIREYTSPDDFCSYGERSESA